MFPVQCLKVLWGLPLSLPCACSCPRCLLSFGACCAIRTIVVVFFAILDCPFGGRSPDTFYSGGKVHSCPRSPPPSFRSRTASHCSSTAGIVPVPRHPTIVFNCYNISRSYSSMQPELKRTGGSRTLFAVCFIGPPPRTLESRTFLHAVRRTFGGTNTPRWKATCTAALL